MAIRPTSSQVVSHSFFSADARAIDLLQTLEEARERLERQRAHCDTVSQAQAYGKVLLA